MSFRLFLEMKDRYIDEVMSHWDGKANSLPFNNIFGDKLRIVIPAYQSKNFHWIEVLCKAAFGQGQFSINWSRNSVSYLIRTKQGEKELEVPIGKVLENMPFMSRKNAYLKQALEDYTKETKKSISDLKTWVSSIYSYNVPDFTVRLNSEVSKQYSDIVKNGTNQEKEFAKNSLEDEKKASKVSHYRTIGKMAKESENPMAIVISRHPIDVLRMSDFEPGTTIPKGSPDITSCHSPDSGFFYCARLEAKYGGPIAFLVPEDKLEGVDLQGNEIFEDDQRNINGILPIARIRFRRYSSKDKNIDLMVPETHIYGDSAQHKAVDFPGKILDFAKKVQKDLVNQKLSLDNFVLRGGDYRDTGSDGSLWNRLLKNKQQSGKNAKHDMEEQIEGYEDNMEHWEAEMGDFYNQYADKLKHCTVFYSAPDEGNGIYVINWRGEMKISFPSNLLNRKMRKCMEKGRAYYSGNINLPELTNKKILSLQSFLKDRGYGYIAGQFVGHDQAINKPIKCVFVPDKSKLEMTLKLVDVDLNHDSNPDDFRDFLDNVYKEYDLGYSKIFNLIRDWMGNNGYFTPTASSSYVKIYNRHNEKENQSDKLSNPFYYMALDNNDEDNWNVYKFVSVRNLSLPGDELQYSNHIMQWKTINGRRVSENIDIVNSPFSELNSLAYRMTEIDLIKQLDFTKKLKPETRFDSRPDLQLNIYISNGSNDRQERAAEGGGLRTVDLALRVLFIISPDMNKEVARSIYNAALRFDKRWPYFEEQAERILFNGYKEILKSQKNPWWSGQDVKIQEPIYTRNQNWPLFKDLEPKLPLVRYSSGGNFKEWMIGEKIYSKKEMIDLGASGYFGHAILKNISIDKIDGLEPTPAGNYRSNRQIKVPIEVSYDVLNDKYILYSGNHRVTQAKMNKQSTILAFVEK
jgi:hypothetical protein